MNAALERTLLHSYADRPYKHSALVNHRGTVVAFAMDDRRRIYYSVLDLAAGDMSQADTSEIDADFWLPNPKPVAFPHEIEQAGFAVLDTVQMPAVKQGTTKEVKDGSLPPSDQDPFLSTTARLTADAPFQVLSDGTHVYLFRQAIGSDDPDLHPLHKREDGGATAGADGRLLDDAGVPVPLVDRTLLVDRYVLAGAELKRTREVRYRRSRNRTRPASAKDSLGAKDMTGNPFYEPTKEVDFVGSLTPGNVSVLLLPTIRTDEQRWQIFAFDAATDEVRSINCARDGDGFFDTQDLTDVRFTLEGRTAGAGLAAQLYYEQEQLPTEEVGKTVKQHARVLLCAATTARDGSDDKPYVAAVDFAVTRDGTLTEIATVAEKETHEADRQHAGESGPPKTPISQEAMDRLDEQVEGLTAMKAARDDLAYAEKMRSAVFYHDTEGPGGRSFVLFAGPEDSNGDPQKDASKDPNLAARKKALLGGTDHSTGPLIGYLKLTDEDTVAEFFPENDFGGTPWTVTESGPLDAQRVPASVKVRRSERAKEKGRAARETLETMEEPPPNLDTLLEQTIAERDGSVVRTEVPAAETQEVAGGPELRVIPMPALAADTADASRVEEALAEMARHEKRLERLGEDIHRIERDVKIVKDAQASAKSAVDGMESEAALRQRKKAISDRLDILRHKDYGTVTLYDRQDRDLNPGWDDHRSTIRINLGNTSDSWPSGTQSKHKPSFPKGLEYPDLGEIKRFKSTSWKNITQQDSWSEHWNNELEFVEIGSEGNIVVTLYEHEEFKGKSKEITSSQKLVGAWKSEASSLKVEFTEGHKQRIRDAQSELDDVQGEIDKAARLKREQQAAQRRSTSKAEGQLRALHAERAATLGTLNELRGIHFEKRLPQPLAHCHTDGQGLTVRSGLLQFAFTDAPPVLFESAVGRLSMYFKGVNDQFFAAYYDLRSHRATWSLPAEHGAVQLTSQTADAGYNKATIKVSDGTEADLCTIDVRNPDSGVVEHWPDVPRDAETVAAVLNGTAMQRTFVGKVAARSGSVGGSGIPLEAATPVRIPAHALVVVEPPIAVSVGDETVGTPAPLTFRTTTSTDSGQSAIDVAAGTVPVGSRVYLVRYDASQARVTPSGYSLDKGSLGLVAKLHGAEGSVQNGTAALVTEAQSPSWVADAPGTAFVFDGEHQYLHSETPEQFAREGDVTIEAWVHPISVGELAEVVHATASDGKGYALGLRETASMTALSFGRDKGYIKVPTLTSSAFHEAFTVEAWVYPTRASSESSQPIVSDDTTDAGLREHDGLEISLVKSHVLASFGTISARSSATLPVDTWAHIACTYDAGGELAIYINGELDETVQSGDSPEGSHPLSIGCGVFKRKGGTGGWFSGLEIPSSKRLDGSLDEIRFWNTCRSQQAIQASMGHRLGGQETGLLAYYTFTDGDIRDRSHHGHHGVLTGGERPTIVASPLTSYGCVSAIGGDVIESPHPIPMGRWTHLAAAFNQSYALRFDGNAYADAGMSGTLDVTGDLTIEAFVQVDDLGRKQGLLSKGTLGGHKSEEEVPYAFYIDEDGFLVFAMETGKGKPETFTSKLVVKASTFHRVAIVRKTDREIEEAEKDGKKTSEVNTYTTITFYIDGEEAGAHKIDEVSSQGNRSPVLIGQARLPNNKVAQFTGAISEVRLYGQALKSNQIGQKVGKDRHGIVAWWRFEENEGLVAYDSKGDAHARLHGPTWIKTPQPNGSTYRLYVNGAPVETKPSAESDLEAGGGSPRFTIGGHDGGRHFEGILEEVRIWKTARSQEQILDNVFTRLRGEKRDLIAYYTFDDVERAGDGQPTRVEDSGPKGNHLEWATGDTPTEVLSTAPISVDTAEVRSALAGVRTDFHATIDGRPAAAEYADLQRDAEGHLHGVHKRCYAYVQDGRWMLVTGYKVGNIKTEWIGQAQFNPQVMGYIEGGPPVPSENFTEGAIELNYGGTNEVTLVESNNVTATVSSSHEDSIQTGFEVEASAGMTFKTSLVAAPLGAGISTELPEVTVKGEVTGGANANGAWSGGESLGSGVNRSTAKSVAVGGGWDQAKDPTAWANPDYTRRWVPSNVGFAFVQSETADVFALRLEHTGTLVGLRMLPNPDIPKDTNIIPFPINNRYTKQGTLDGRLGIKKGGNAYDPDYATSGDYGEDSYFKPRQAYQLKRRIQEEEEKLKAYFASFDTTPQETHAMQTVMKGVGVAAGAATMLGGPGVGLIGGALAGGIGGTVASAVSHLAAGDDRLAEKFARRNLVNTYVWTADGGFYEESTQISEVRSESASGSYELSGQLSGGVSFEIDSPVSVSAGITGTVGGGVSTALSKDKEEETSFELDLSLDVPDDLGQYEYEKPGDLTSGVQPVYDKDGNGVNQPGKVDAYRFMTFYLEPKRDNFEDLFETVVDPIWLEQSQHPNAAALRQANQAEQKPLCWRVFHRVTFVSRLLPDVATGTEPHAEALRQVDIGSSYELVRRLEPDVKDHTADWPTFRDAVRKAVHKRLPELADENDLEQIVDILAGYFEVTE
ncbi:LamG-like jellyroll fold domain-containing protein [Rubrivirga sp. IMCC45206]|uniref:LamG domain-containing protein n=1 Tax=Rubrivirga sp. IMCC45206 TaxID=3391614 RepID=UPI00398FE18E